ncbi:hypothetical protein GmHk_U059866 [Glycine max]|nr:hypothetical protein GmHk_U059866 [Glycine max]
MDPVNLGKRIGSRGVGTGVPVPGQTRHLSVDCFRAAERESGVNRVLGREMIEQTRGLFGREQSTSRTVRTRGIRSV